MVKNNATAVREEWQAYSDYMLMLGNGVALWHPRDDATLVRLGDVGFVEHGRFVPLFNVYDRPDPRASLDCAIPEPPILGSSRLPGPLYSRSVIPNWSGPSITPFSLDPDAPLAFRCAGTLGGAILVTKRKTVREDFEPSAALRSFAVKHRSTWLAAARASHPRLALDDLILVTGRDLTDEYAMLVIPPTPGARPAAVEFDADEALPPADATLSSDEAYSVWGAWKSDVPVHQSCCALSRPAEPSGPPPSPSPGASPSRRPRAPEYRRCVFVRGYRVRMRLDGSASGASSAEDASEVEASAADRSRGSRSSFVDPLSAMFDYIFETSPTAQIAVVHDDDFAVLLRSTASIPDETVHGLLRRLRPAVDVTLDGAACIRLPGVERVMDLSVTTTSHALVVAPSSSFSSPSLRRARGSTTSLPSSPLPFQVLTSRDDREGLVSSHTTTGEFSTLPSSSSQAQAMEARFGRPTAGRVSLPSASTSTSASSSSPASAVPSTPDTEKDRSRARKTTNPFALPSFFTRGSKADVLPPQPPAPAVMSLADLIDALAPPAQPSLAHARALVPLLTQGAAPRAAVLSPVLGSLCAQESPAALQLAGWDSMAAYWVTVAASRSEQLHLSSADRIAHFALLLAARTWTVEGWESRYKALHALVGAGIGGLGIERKLVQLTMTWILEAFQRLVSGEAMTALETAERQRCVGVLSEFLTTLLRRPEIAPVVFEEDVHALLRDYEKMVLATLKLPSEVPSVLSPLNMSPATPATPSTPFAPMSMASGTFPARMPYTHRRHPSSSSVPTMAQPLPQKHPFDVAVEVLLKFLESHHDALPSGHLKVTLPLLFRCLCRASSPLPTLSATPTAQLLQLSHLEHCIVMVIQSFLSGINALSCVLILQQSLSATAGRSDSDMALAAQVSMGAFRMLRILIRQPLRERISRPHLSRRSSSHNAMSADSYPETDRFLGKDDVSAWEPSRFAAVMRSSIADWVNHCRHSRPVPNVEEVFDEAAGIVKDMLAEYDHRNGLAVLEDDEASAAGGALMELAQYVHVLRPKDGGSFILPLAEPKDAPTPFLRTLSTLLSRGHTSTPLRPSLATILLSVVDNLTDVDTAKLPLIMGEQKALSPTSPDWLDNWRRLLGSVALYTQARPLTREAVFHSLREVYDTVKDMLDYRRPLADIVLDFCKRQVQREQGRIEDRVPWDILGEEAAARSSETQGPMVQYDADGEVLVENINEDVAVILDFLTGIALDSDPDDEAPLVDDSNPSPILPTPRLSSSVSSPVLSRRPSELHGHPRGPESMNAMSMLSTLANAPHPPSLPEDTPVEPTPSPVPANPETAVRAVAALVTAFNELVFSPLALAEHNLVTATRVFLSLLSIIKEAQCARARLAALQFLMRLRADRDHRIYYSGAAHDPDKNVRSLATIIGRTPESASVIATPQPERQSRNVLPASARLEERGLRGRGAQQSTSRTSRSSRSRSRAPGPMSSAAPTHPAREPMWSLPDNLPFTIVEKHIPSERLTSYDPSGPGRKVVLPLSDYIDAIEAILEHERDAEIVFYILCYLPSQLSNKHLFCGPKCRGSISALLRSMCEPMRNGVFATKIDRWPVGLKAGDVLSLAYHTLSVLISYRRSFSEHLQSVLVEVLVKGLNGQPSAIRCCLHALTLAAFEMQKAMTRKMAEIFDKLAQIMSNPLMPVHIINFVAIVGSLPALYSNFTREHFKKVFVVALKYLQDHNRRGASVAGSWALSQHVRIMSFAIVYTWFLAVDLPDRQYYIADITKGLLEANEGNEDVDEPTAVCFDWLARYTYASADPRPATSLLGDMVSSPADPAVQEKTWILGQSALVTIRALQKRGWIEVLVRRPSGLTKFLCRVENVPMVGPGDVDPDMLSIPALLMMDREPDDDDPEPAAGDSAVAEQEVPAGGDAPRASASKPDPITGYIWSGTAPSQRRKEVAIDPSFFALQLSPYPSNSQVKRGLLVRDKEKAALARFVRNLDRLPVIDTHAIGILYVAPGQVDEVEILRNTHGSPAYTRFLASLGRLINLHGQKDVYAGGLEPAIDGDYAYAWWDDIGQILYHSATLMPFNPQDPNCTRKKSHIGNDRVRIVWNDSAKPYPFDMLKTQFQFVNIVIEPHSLGAIAAFSDNVHENEYFKVTIQRAEGMAEFTPIGDFKLISAEALPLLVRQLSLLADWFAQIFQFTNQDSNHEEVPTNWRERLRSIRRFAASQQAAAAAAEEEAADSEQPLDGMRAQQAYRDFSAGY